jgi:predicted dinucleotide-binding enzyme
MRIAIIGAGHVGTALALGWSRAGHDIILGVREAANASRRSLAAEIKATAASPAAAAQQGEVVVLALPWAAAEQAVRSLGNLAGKIVIDCMNPLGPVDGGLGLTVGHTTSGGETVAGWLPGTKVIKTLNQVGAEIMADNRAMAHRPAMFMAGDDSAAKDTVGRLLADLGFEPFDAGGLVKARILEPYAMVWINQAMLRGKGRNWAFAAVDCG